MAAVKQLNQNAEIINRAGSLFMNINAAKGLHDVMRTNLGECAGIPTWGGTLGRRPSPRSCAPCACSQIWAVLFGPLPPLREARAIDVALSSITF